MSARCYAAWQIRFESTFLSRGDHINRLSCQDEERGRKLISKEPELRYQLISISKKYHCHLKGFQARELDKKRMTYVHSIILLERALIALGLAHENDNRPSATEESVSRALVSLP